MCKVSWPKKILLITFNSSNQKASSEEKGGSPLLYMRGAPKTQNLFIKILHIYSYMFKFQSPSKYSQFDAIHLLRCFFHCLKQYFNLQILMPFNASTIFCFTSSTLAKHFPLRTSFHPENKQKVTQGEIRWTGRVGHGGHDAFGQKPLNTQHGVDRYAHKSPIVIWANTMKSSKNCHWS